MHSEIEEKVITIAEELVEDVESLAEIAEKECKPLPNYVYPPNCGKRKRHTKRRGRQYGRKY